MIRLSKPTRRRLPGAARLAAVGAASALLCLGAALVAPMASAAPTAPVANSAAFLAGNPCTEHCMPKDPPDVPGCHFHDLVNGDGEVISREMVCD